MRMKVAPPRLHPKIWLYAELACLALLACLLLGKGVLPGWRWLNTDFPNYYLVARLLREGFSLDRIYDWVWLQRIKDHWGLSQPLVGFAGLTPLSALPVFPLAGLAALNAKRVWIVLNILFLFGTVETLQRVTGLGRRRIWTLGLLAVLPLRTSFLFGQMHILVLLLLSLAFFFRYRRNGIACGVCIALAGALKVYPLLFVFYFAWKRQWSEVLSVVCATAALLGVGYACMGSHVMHIYLTQIFPRSMQGEVLDPYNSHSASAAALLHRLFLFEPDLNPSPVWNRPVLYSIFYPLWQVAVLFPLFLGIRPSSDDRQLEKLEWAVFLIALLVLSPVPSSYHFVVLILPIVLAADVLLSRKLCGRLALITVLYFAVSADILPLLGRIVPSLKVALAFSRLWLSLLLWIYLLFYLWHEVAQTESKRSTRFRAALLSGILCVCWVAGFISYQHHFAYFEEDIRARLPLPTHALLANGIHPTASGFIATKMTSTAYQIADQNGKAVWPLTQAGTDQLSSTATPASPLLYMEVADVNGSRIISPNASALQIPDAQYPAISPDGATLAYIRERKGRGSLRIVHLAFSQGSMSLSDDKEIVGEPYDVRNAALAPSGDVIFTARVNDKTSIYTASPGKTPSVLVSGKEDAEAGSVSRDGQRLVFCRLVRNRWQLVMMNLVGRQERQLTFGDCNAYSPAWMNDSTIAYATDCGRGLGLTALASINVDH